jgi:hypothetical protein
MLLEAEEEASPNQRWRGGDAWCPTAGSWAPSSRDPSWLRAIFLYFVTPCVTEMIIEFINPEFNPNTIANLNTQIQINNKSI